MNDLPKARLSGRVVSRGNSSGLVFLLPKNTELTDRSDLSDDDIQLELEKLDTVIASVSDQLRKASEHDALSISNEAREIIDAQIALVTDPLFTNKVRERIRLDRFGSQLAVRVVTEEYTDQLLSLDDEHLREKAADLQDICDRLLSTLSAETTSVEVPLGAVVVCAEIWPTTILELASKEPAAIVTESGGWTSHAFILARELGIPAISGVKNATQRLSNGDNIIVDAVNGHITYAEQPRETHSGPTIEGSTAIDDEVRLDSKVKLADEYDLDFIANVDSAEKCRKTIESGITEIGLVRSEYLFDLTDRLPDETSQTTAYQEIVAAANGREVAIRTFDVSVGKLVAGGARRERNPALGMRSIRLTLRYERQFRAQLRALIRANSSGNLSIVIPMVAGAADVIRVRSLLIAEFEELRRKDPSMQLPALGAMIELPSAVLTIDQILEVVDFVCIGTNDLVQYTLGVDRDNETVADWYQTLHPAILRSIRRVVEAANAKNKPATVCGESAGSPFYLPMLVGLGVRRFSMNPSSIPAMISYGSSLKLVECKRLADNMLLSTLASQNEKALAEFCFELWPDLADERVNFPPAISSNF